MFIIEKLIKDMHFILYNNIDRPSSCVVKLIRFVFLHKKSKI